MKVVSAVEARKGLGRLLNLVSLRRETFVIERAGKKLAVLTSCKKEKKAGMRPSGKLDIRDMAGVGAEIWKSVNVDDYLRRERAEWA